MKSTKTDHECIVKGHFVRVETYLPNKYYFSYLLFREHGHEEAAEKFLYWSTERREATKSLDQDVITKRELGLKLKKEGNTSKSKEVFAESAKDGDPVSQYELALLLGPEDVLRRDLLEKSSPLLFQSKIELYAYYVAKHLYDEAYTLLIEVLQFSNQVGIKLEQLTSIPNIPNFFSPRDLPNILYEKAMNTQDQQAQVDLYSLAATQGHAKSIVALKSIQSKSSGKEIDVQAYIKGLIVSGQNGNNKSHDKVVALARQGDSDVLAILFEEANCETPYFIKVAEEAATNGHPVTQCMLGMLYYEGVGVKKDSKKGKEILKETLPFIEELAFQGNAAAQFQLGWMYKEGCVSQGKSYQLALKWLSKSAIFFLPALHELGDLYFYGIDLGNMRLPYTDPKQAEICYTKAAELGYPLSQVMVGGIALDQGDYERALKFFEKGMSKAHRGVMAHLQESPFFGFFGGGMYRGYRGYQHRLKGLLDEGDDLAKKMVITLADMLLKNAESQSNARKWAQSILQLHENKKNSVTQQIPVHLAEQQANQPVPKDDEPSDQHNNQQVMTFAGVIYDNPEWVAKASIDAVLMQEKMGFPHNSRSFVLRLPYEGGLLDTQNSTTSWFWHFNPVFSGEGRRLAVSLPWEIALDEKLTAQAEYFSQEGVTFETFQDAIQIGRVALSGDFLEPTEAKNLCFFEDSLCLFHLYPTLLDFSL